MARRLAPALVVLVAAGALAACTGSQSSTYGQSQSVALPPVSGNLVVRALLPPNTIGAGYPDNIGHFLSKFWHADVAGFTQTHYSQVLGFPPGTKITITNISTGSELHTLNVIAKRTGPPANFPTNPKLLFTPSGGTKLVVGYRSGTINPGKSVTVTLVKGEYLIGCAYHYGSDNMRDVVVVAKGAKPGPTATPPAP
jgi:plastocyanin